MGSLGKLRAALLFSVAFAPALFCQKLSEFEGANAWLQAAAAAPPKTASAPQLTPSQWHEDLRFLSSQLAKRHVNAFHFISREAFDREVQELDSRLDQLNPDQIFVGMDRIENSVGDGHTYIRPPADSPVYPVRFGYFGDQYRLLATAGSPHSPQVAGGRLLSIDDVPIAHVHELLLTLTPADETQPLREVRAAALLSNGLVLHGLGITAERDKVRYLMLAEDGKQVSLELAATSGALRSERKYVKEICPETPLRNSLIAYQLHGLANHGLEPPKIHRIEGQHLSPEQVPRLSLHQSLTFYALSLPVASLPPEALDSAYSKCHRTRLV
jgi:hypothetical protein